MILKMSSARAQMQTVLLTAIATTIIGQATSRKQIGLAAHLLKKMRLLLQWMNLISGVKKSPSKVANGVLVFRAIQNLGFGTRPTNESMLDAEHQLAVFKFFISIRNEEIKKEKSFSKIKRTTLLGALRR